ncbi:MAG: cyclic nucleotide-binding domain-containing protein [Gemmataceae bacterium]|nr:cyclic nucleotide-binding domain-containing protein [Gemmataceae bacterium]
MNEYDFAVGDIFFRAGDPSDRAFLVIAGQVESVVGANRVAAFGPGDVFGDMALVEERPRWSTARAVTAGRVRAMTRDDFERLLTTDPAACRQYLRSLLERVRSLTARVNRETDTPPPAPTPRPVLVTGPAELPDTGLGRPVPDGWSVVLTPLTPRAAETVPSEGLRVGRMPFRLGRAAEAREGGGLDLNDLWLNDRQPFVVSRNHCEIDLTRNGLVVRDRGSQLGCVVNGRAVGGRAAVRFAPLAAGDNTLVLGPAGSAYRFKVTVAGGAPAARTVPALPAGR